MSSKANPIKKSAQEKISINEPLLSSIKPDYIDKELDEKINGSFNNTLKALQSDSFPRENWSMIPPYVHMEFLDIFAESSYKRNDISIFNDIKNKSDLFEKLFFSTIQENDDPLKSMQNYYADRNLIAAFKEASIDTDAIETNQTAAKTFSISFDVFNLDSLNTTKDSPDTHKFLRALLTFGATFKIYFGYPKGSMNIQNNNEDNKEFDLQEYNKTFGDNPYYSMTVTNHAIPDITLDQKGILRAKVNFLETSTSYMRSGDKRILSEAATAPEKDIWKNSTEKMLTEIKNSKNKTYKDILEIIFKYYKFPVNQKSNSKIYAS